ncbi:MAG TPA: DUF523 and DUF1722 domain-containing protein [Acidobacteriota bacterium]|nr:DUF523 and DUF1722 domain-containing protein [Acidobacteriota bacterium]
METKIRLGISSCLLGNAVRYDGGHKLDRFIVETLGKYVEYVPVCPEVECGMPVPRESMRLEGDPESPRLITTRTRMDKTDQMMCWTKRRVLELEQEGLMGFIFKSDSPSSGMERVKIYNDSGMASRKGVGMFARAFMEHFPLLPVEEEGRLHDPALRENFVERIFALARWREVLAGKADRGDLVAFHSRHKLLILAHSAKHYQELGRLVAQVKQSPLRKVFEEYQKRFMEALKLRATAKKNANVLMHMAGYFKDQLSSGEKAELAWIIEMYRREMIPLIVPITLLQHYVRKYDQPYLRDQYYLNPHPIELQLRNHV